MAVPPRSVVHTIATHRLVPIGDVLENLKGEGQRRGREGVCMLRGYTIGWVGGVTWKPHRNQLQPYIHS